MGTARLAILGALVNGRVRFTDLVELVKKSEVTVSKALSDLEIDGLIRRTEAGWELTTQGADALRSGTVVLEGRTPRKTLDALHKQMLVLIEHGYEELLDLCETTKEENGVEPFRRDLLVARDVLLTMVYGRIIPFKASLWKPKKLTAKKIVDLLDGTERLCQTMQKYADLAIDASVKNFILLQKVMCEGHIEEIEKHVGGRR